MCCYLADRLYRLSELIYQSPTINQFWVEGTVVDGETLETLASHNRADLSSLALSFTHISYEVFECVCRPSPYLSSVVMTYVGPQVDPNGTSIGDDHDALVRALSTHCLEIEILSLRKWCITDSALIALTNLIYLHELDLSGCSNVTSGGVCSLLVSLSGKLEKLSLTGDYIDTTLLQSIAENCTILTCLKLHFRDLGIDLALIYASLVYMIIKCPLLEIADFGNQVSILADVIMITLSHACRTLKSLDMAGATYTALRRLLSSCPLLDSINLINMTPFIDTTLPIEETPCPSLTSITIQSEYMTDEQLCGILKLCPNLQIFIIACPLVSDATILALSQHCLKLTLIAILGPSQVTSAAPLTGFTLLRYIDAQAEVTGETLLAFSVNCKYLKTVILRRCIGILCNDVLRFIGSCPSLRKLTIGGCWNVEEGEALKRQINAVYPRVTFGLAV